MVENLFNHYGLPTLWLMPRVHYGYRSLPTEATGGLFGRPMSDSGRPTTDKYDDDNDVSDIGGIMHSSLSSQTRSACSVI
ncbi:hypothetical protein MSG28_011814 [Choristoneura fumiferana]|uniref:Uncharacterized protein n=1 Tax=Choristoneura fumiferana TaxID=7141 RepID=A0ACC0KMG5_CHOFU|nr:hypothetical protein MSG28_011814 [Choristoneura fumiferana]